MALTLTYDEIRRELGRFLGIGEDPLVWDSADVTRIADVIKRGSRRFYFPEPGMIEDQPLIRHDWSFIKDTLSVTLTANTTYHDLPSDFERMVGIPSLVGGEYPLELKMESELRHLANAGDGEGEPQYYTIQRETPSSEDLLYQVGLYPQPKALLSLEGWYLFDPPVPSASQAPVVPSNHAETYLAALLAQADEVFNYETQSEGRHLERFKKLLASSILYDRSIGGTAI